QPLMAEEVVDVFARGHQRSNFRYPYLNTMPVLPFPPTPAKVGDSNGGFFRFRGKRRVSERSAYADRVALLAKRKGALSENLTKWPYYAALPILRTARSSRLLTARRLAL